MEWYQVTAIVLLVLSVVTGVLTAKSCAGLLGSLTSTALWTWLLIVGGFFA